jgi:hypothetical protein
VLIPQHLPDDFKKGLSNKHVRLDVYAASLGGIGTIT